MYLDFVVNFVDVRDVAVGLILAMEKGRVGHRYILGGESIPLKQVLALMSEQRPPKTVRSRSGRACGTCGLDD